MRYIIQLPNEMVTEAVTMEGYNPLVTVVNASVIGDIKSERGKDETDIKIFEGANSCR